MTQTKVEQQDFSAGIQRGINPLEIDPRAVIDHVNGFYERDGSPYRRGGTDDYSAAFGSTGLTFLNDSFYDAGQRTLIANAADFGVLPAVASDSVVNLGSDGLNLAAPSALLNSMLFIGGGYIYGGSRKAAAYSTGTISLTNGSKTVTGSGTTWNTLVDAGMLLQRGNERVYVVDSIDSTTQLTLRDAYEGVTGSGVTYALNHIYKITTADPYPDAAFYFICANRLCYPVRHNVLGFSDVEKPHKQTSTVEASEIANEHPFPDGVELIGGATVGQTALCFTTGGMYAVDGLAFGIVDAAGNPQHRVQLAARESVLWTNTGIASWEQAIIAPTLDGIYILDGVRGPQSISYAIDDLYRLYISQGYRTGQATVYRGHYFLPILNASGTAIRDTLVCKLDRPVRSGGQVVFPWSRLSGSGGSMSAFAVRHSSTSTEPRLLGAEVLAGSKVYDCSAFFEPDDGHSLDADDTTHTWLLTTRDYPAGDLNLNTVRRLMTRYELTDPGGLTIVGQWDWGGDDTEADPGDGFFNLDALLFPDMATELYISQTDKAAVDQEEALAFLTEGIRFELEFAGATWTFDITGAPVDNGDWWTIPVAAAKRASADVANPATLRYTSGEVHPTIEFDYGFGRREEGGFLWDAFDWADESLTEDPDDLYWEDDDDEEWFALDCPAPADNGAHRHRCRVNTKARSMRFRLRCNKPAGVLRLRSLEMFVRPSDAARN